MAECGALTTFTRERGATKKVHWNREPTIRVTKTVCDRNFVLKCETKNCEVMFILLTVSKI